MSRSDPALSYNFSVTLLDSSTLLAIALTAIHLSPAGGFSECSGLESTLDVEDYKEGGNNGTILHFPSRVSPKPITLKRGFVTPDLWRWQDDFARGVGRRRDGLITLYDDQRKPLSTWSFLRAMPTRWRGPSFNATASQVAVEEMEIVHEGLQIVPTGA